MSLIDDADDLVKELDNLKIEQAKHDEKVSETDVHSASVTYPFLYTHMLKEVKVVALLICLFTLWSVIIFAYGLILIHHQS